jgi:hypothetical protein
VAAVEGESTSTDQPRLGDERLPRQPGAGDREIGLVPAVGTLGRDDAGLDHHLAGQPQPGTDAHRKPGHQRAMDVRGRRHRDDLAIEQLVARVRAVVERQELVESPKPPCWLSHLQSSI